VGQPDWVVLRDATDPRLDPFRHLRDADIRHAVEAEHGVFVAEGTTVIRRLVRSEVRSRAFLLLPRVAEQLADDLAGCDATVFVADRDIMASVAGFDVHRGALALAERPPARDAATLIETARTLAVLEGLNDHENLGAVIRSAGALGIDGLLLDPTCADPLYRRTVRVSMGEVLFLPWARLQPWPDALARLRAAGFAVVALTPSADAAPIGEVLATVPRRVALLLGAEGPGLSSGALAAADRRARIPMRDQADSLNVGHAAAIAFHLVMNR
jgi:tRNA G18 (ribose-2'-O)-methylase SpoU